MAAIYEVQDLEWWNNLHKDELTESEAVNEDIVIHMILDDIEMAFLCQRDNNQNNIVALRLSNKADVRCVKMMYAFCIVLLNSYNIQYVAIHGKYNFLRKFWPHALKGNRDTWYCDLLKAEEMLREEAKEIL